MNTTNIDFKFLVESDNNPLIVFNHNGKIIYLNSNAEVLMSYANVHDVFELALKNAPKEYGNKTTQIELNFNQLNFYAINVSYISDEWIAIRLYYRPRDKMLTKRNKSAEIPTDLNSLLDIAITQFKIDSSSNIRLFTDQDIPKVMLNQNNFLKLLRKVLALFKATSYIDITLKVGIGEHIIIEGQRYPLIDLIFSSNGRYCDDDDIIKNLAKELCLVANLKENSIFFEIPLIRN